MLFFILHSIVLTGEKGEAERRSEETHMDFKTGFERKCTLFMYFAFAFPLCMHLSLQFLSLYAYVGRHLYVRQAKWMLVGAVQC